MSAIAILRPVMVTLAEGARRPRKYFSITWRGPYGDATADLHYSLTRAQEVAKECGAAEIIIEDGAAREASPAPRLADMTFEDIQQLREETL
jgi:hypothetical protein